MGGRGWKRPAEHAADFRLQLRKSDLDYEIHIESERGVDVLTARHPSVVEAYDACAQQMAQRPDALAAHLILGGYRLHTIKRRKTAA